VGAVLAALAQPFELEDGLVWRAALATFGEDRHVFGIAVSHIAFDGWSESILARDLSVAYREESFASPAPTLADVRASYDERRRRAALDRQREHWRRALEGVPPLDVPEAPLGPHPLAQALVPVSNSTAEALRAGARRRGRSVLGPLVAASAAALGRTFQADDFALGVPVARRGGRELETAVGCLIDVVCIRVRPRLDGTVDESDLAAAESAVEAALRNQDLPIDEIVALVSPERTRRRLLYQTILTLQNNPRAILDLPGVEATQLDVPHLGTPTDLLSEVWLEPEGSARVVVTGHEAGVADDVAEAWSETLSSVVELAGAVAR
jgi:hypothetical protein